MSDFENFDDALEFLSASLRGGISKLLEEAKRKGCIAPPYGRPPVPSPFVDESQIDEEALLQEDLSGQKLDIDNFDYEYGFNPLLFLSDFIRRVHPASVASRKRDCITTVKRLEHRANHARKQLSTANDLKHRVNYLRSGILQGPLSAPVTANSVMIWCRAAVSGTVIVEVSKSKLFSSVHTNEAIPSFSMKTGGPDDPVTIVVNDLNFSTRYFVRCHLLEAEVEEADAQLQPDSAEDDYASKVLVEDDSVVETPPLEQTSYAHGQFWTLPNVVPESRGLPKGKRNSSDEDRNAPPPIELIALTRQPAVSAHDLITLLQKGLDRPCDNFDPPPGFGAVSIDAKHPVLTCFVGDLFDPIPADAVDNAAQEQIWNLFSGQDATLSAAAGVGPRQYCSRSPATMSSLFLAWNDSQPGSATDLKAEEVVHKQFSYDMRRYEKKLKEKQDKADKEASGGQGAKSSKRAVAPPPVFHRPDMSTTFRAIVKVCIIHFYIWYIVHNYMCIYLSIIYS